MFKHGNRVNIVIDKTAYEIVKKLAKKDKVSLSFMVNCLTRETLVMKGELLIPTPDETERRALRKVRYSKRNYAR